MQIVTSLAELPAGLRGGAIAIGNFDGVHRGHQELLAATRAEAEGRGAAWGVVTFEPHPRTYFRPEEPVFRLTPLPLKSRLVAALGASFMVVLTFDRPFSSLEPQQFVEEYLVKRLAVSHVVMGYDFHFGKGRKGTPATMREFGERYGFGVSVVEQVTDEGDAHSPFSSSSIRSALRHGHVASAAHELGYYWTVMGEVIQGDQRGRTIGFPTINMALEPGAEPYRGIYAMRVRDSEVKGSKPWMGAGYFGDRPTFNSEHTYLEVYLLDFAGDLYGRMLMVEVVELIRPDRRFATIGELTSQMREDCARAQALLEADAAKRPLASFPLGRLQAEGRI
jgi:riboflavin kinase/FMN adenylyltransferase